ncbi:MAG: alpha/beta hydrolase fold domain-containing protein [Phycisphaera sp.]|nr:alpha/beta hydrolase fold domain-containing protein [Phycisphaera sp.]
MKAMTSIAPKPVNNQQPLPTHADVKYGPYDSNVLDFWQAESDKPTPVVVYIHGGGFLAGDKTGANRHAIDQYLKAGVSCASINYRFLTDAPIQDILHDAARAIQFIRYKSKDWNVDKKRIASYGGSAGAGTSLWLATHDDLADPDNADPVLRESSRLVAAGMVNGQFSYDLTQWSDVLKAPNTLFGSPDFHTFYHFDTADQMKTDAGKKVLAECDMLGMITPDDPPVYLYCTLADAPPRNTNQFYHHPEHERIVAEHCKKAGVEACLNLTRAGVTPPNNLTIHAFMLQKLGVTKAAE